MVYEQFLQLLNWPAGSALALLMTAVVLLFLWAGARLARRWETPA